MIPKDILEELDNVIVKHTRRIAHNRDIYLVENTLLTEYCLHPECDPWQIAALLNTQSGTEEYNGHKIIHKLRNMNLNISERKQIIQTALQMGEVGFNCLNGDMPSFKQFRDYTAAPNIHPNEMRCVLMALFVNHPVLQKLEHAKGIFHLSRSYAKNCLLDIIYNAEDIYRAHERDVPSSERFEQQLARKEEQLRRTNEILEELQNEFEIQIQESKTQEIANFFSSLNSEKYGFILDGLFATKAGLDELKKRRYELPVEINGLTILIRKLVQFVKDSGINPVLRIGTIMTVKSKDIENYTYRGSPFKDDQEVKKVEVISPGWQFKDKDRQLSRPTIKEIKEEKYDR
ncbi:MAG: hypothetical protein LBK43_01485 [Treponema sp.]|nr:hypothetical protein [Treponema sp.]